METFLISSAATWLYGMRGVFMLTTQKVIIYLSTKQWTWVRKAQEDYELRGYLRTGFMPGLLVTKLPETFATGNTISWWGTPIRSGGEYKQISWGPTATGPPMATNWKLSHLRLIYFRINTMLVYVHKCHGVIGRWEPDDVLALTSNCAGVCRKNRQSIKLSVGAFSYALSVIWPIEMTMFGVRKFVEWLYKSTHVTKLQEKYGAEELSFELNA